MPLSYTVDITNGVGPTAITNAATVLAQGTLSAGKPIRIKRIELQSNQTGLTQTVIPVAIGTYATATGTGGVAPVAKAVDHGNTTTGATLWRCLTATLGTTFTQITGWQWNGASFFDETLGLTETQQEFSVSSIFALIIPAASGTPSITGTITYEEFG